MKNFATLLDKSISFCLMKGLTGFYRFIMIFMSIFLIKHTKNADVFNISGCREYCWLNKVKDQ